ncbi:MAG: leucine-rich repeat protein [Eubacterium sp.]|nr:leucine-rich repeat protein [Eubacterium sp.]
MKKILSLVLTIVLIMSVVSAIPFSASAETSGAWTYYLLNDNTAEIENYSGNESVLEIPSEIDGYKVTSISDYAICYDDTITSVTVPNTVTKIGHYVFCECPNLNIVNLPDSLTSVSYILYNSGYFNNESNWENGVLYIGNYLISANSTCPENYTVKDGTKVISEYAFSSNSSITNLVIPGSVINIGSSAFYNCKSLKSVTINDGAKSIESAAFKDCTSLDTIAVPESLTNIESDAFINTAYLKNESNWDNNVLYMNKALIIANDSISGNYAVKDGTKLISENSFLNCKSLTGINIPKSVENVCNCVFDGCSGLESIVVDSENTSYDSRNNCNALIDSKANVLLRGCKNTVIPVGIKTIGSSAFNNCKGLKSAVLQSGVETIEDLAFYGCSDLESITIPSTLKKISSFVFEGCDSLKIVNIESIEAWCSISFDYETASNPLGITHMLYLNGVPVENLKIPDTVTAISDGVFYGYDGLKSVIIPDSVTYIGNLAFSNCLGLKEVTIPKSVSYLGWSVFSGCSGLESVTIPKGISEIKWGVFENCTVLKNVYYQGTKDEWNKIVIGEYNESLKKAMIHFADSNSEPSVPSLPQTPAASAATPAPQASPIVTAPKTTVILKKVTVKKSAKKLILQATVKVDGKAVKGKKVTFKFNGKKYTAKTNAKGVAKVTIKKAVLKKLKKGKKVTYSATYNKVTAKKTVKVK